MSCLSVLNLAIPPSLTWGDAFGYPSAASIEARDSTQCNLQERNWLFWNNIANFSAYFIGPLVGLIRVIANVILLARGRDFCDNDPKNVFSEQTKLYLKVQIGRGAFETIGGGNVLWVGDLFAMIVRSVRESQSKNQSANASV